uniref:MAGE domain-containing protein n=1 Tax=Rhinolophus ferrumequinum TaxID=59479 RepID=A0A671DM70_RHIFE
ASKSPFPVVLYHQPSCLYSCLLPPPRVRMSQYQKIPHCTRKQHHAHNETQRLEVAQVSKSLEETHLSSHPLVPGNSKETVAAGTDSIPQCPQSAYSSNTVIRVTSSKKSNKLFGRQGKNSSASSKYLPGTENLTLNPLDEKATLLVDFLLCEYKMNVLQTKKADMIDIVIKEDRDAFPEILRKASDHMELVFGVEVKEVESSSHSYALVNKLGLTYDPRLSGEEGAPNTSLLIFILGVIFVKGNHATEEEILEVLNMIDLYSWRENFMFRSKHTIKNLVWQKYLEYQQVPNSDPPRYEYLWGPRAHTEVSKKKLLEFLTKISQSHPTCFPPLFEKALRNEVEKARAAARAGCFRI